MPGFVQAVLSDANLDDLLAYLRQMSIQRQRGNLGGYFLVGLTMLTTFAFGGSPST